MPDTPEFDPNGCLFCDELSHTLDLNTTHMALKHSFVVPYQEYLSVDLETILSYCQLVIFRYRECLSCDSRRGTIEGIQQHMNAKGHCRFDVNEATAKFYTSNCPAHDSFSNIAHDDGKSLRLPSGKLLAHRDHRDAGSATQPRRSHSGTPGSRTRPTVSSRNTSTSYEVATLGEENIPAARSTQLSRLTINDQRNLAHLPNNEVRSLIAIGLKHKDQARRAESRAKSKLERAANTNLFEFYRPDGPDRMKRGWAGGG